MIIPFIAVSDFLKILELQQRVHDLEIQSRPFWDAMPTGIGLGIHKRSDVSIAWCNNETLTCVDALLAVVVCM